MLLVQDQDFALAKDRATALKLLIPGTEDYYYYHALHALIALRNRLKHFGANPPAAPLAPERRAALHAAFDQLDREDAGGATP